MKVNGGEGPTERLGACECEWGGGAHRAASGPSKQMRRTPRKPSLAAWWSIHRLGLPGVVETTSKTNMPRPWAWAWAWGMWDVEWARLMGMGSLGHGQNMPRPWAWAWAWGMWDVEWARFMGMGSLGHGHRHGAWAWGMGMPKPCGDATTPTKLRQRLGLGQAGRRAGGTRRRHRNSSGNAITAPAAEQSGRPSSACVHARAPFGSA